MKGPKVTCNSLPMKASEVLEALEEKLVVVEKVSIGWRPPSGTLSSKIVVEEVFIGWRPPSFFLVNTGLISFFCLSLPSFESVGWRPPSVTLSSKSWKPERSVAERKANMRAGSSNNGGGSL
eukprot:gnl/MRDRNA2_/MRDRNA2_269712_c0_seq1.p2 gnl/MRDRNA2_/MRDRNA2_269712_c0~~gnl/MRDRNA2_/MRDRNA2_269712_c0_seq1.p2  ORF type:complete len:133 (+),score=18.34 gnl/MRDRNA2_/MRDRNA2_269712_c0_seq1:36-401(+)